MEKLHAFGEGSEFNKQAPEFFPILKVGKNRFTRNNKVSEFDVTSDDLDVIMHEFESRGKELVLDFGHSSLNKDAGFRGDAPAAGWGDSLKKTAEGIVAHVREWTPKGRERIENGEYNYGSPVVFFDEKTGRPNALHSAAVTNIPAIHGFPKLVAASDFWEEDESNVVIEKYKKLATDVVGNIRKMKSELEGIMVSLSDLAGEDKELKTQFTEFADGLFKEDLEAFQEQTKATEEAPVTPEEKIEPEAFQDIESEFDNVKNSMNGDDLLGWLNTNEARLSKELTQADEGNRVGFQEEIDFINTKRGQLTAFKDENPELWAKGLIEKAEETVIAPPALAFSDSMVELIKSKQIAFADVDLEQELKMEDVENELKSLYDFKESTIQVLDDLGTDDLSKVVDVIKTVNDNAKDVEAKSYVSSCIADPECRITIAMEDWAIGAYKKDKEMFKKQYAGSPVAFSQNLISVSQPDKNKAKVSKVQNEVADAFGNNPDDVYNKN